MINIKIRCPILLKSAVAFFRTESLQKAQKRVRCCITEFDVRRNRWDNNHWRVKSMSMIYPASRTTTVQKGAPHKKMRFWAERLPGISIIRRVRPCPRCCSSWSHWMSRPFLRRRSWSWSCPHRSILGSVLDNCTWFIHTWIVVLWQLTFAKIFNKLLSREKCQPIPFNYMHKALTRN